VDVSAFELAFGGDNAPINLRTLREQAAEPLAERLAGWQEKYPDAGADGAAVVVGRRGRGSFANLLLGFTSQDLLFHAPCPSAVIRADTSS
jgi:nucleotide-binding universal stress UspA family protein